MASRSEAAKSRKQKETEDYLSKIKLKEVFEILLMNVITKQPEDPITYFHEEITKIKKEMEELNVEIHSTTFLTSPKTTVTPTPNKPAQS